MTYIKDGTGYHHTNISIDRIDNDGNYEPGNVRWVTKGENTRNRHKEKK